MTPTDGKRLADILLVEDSIGDIALVKAYLKRWKVRLNLHVARDGQEALDHLLAPSGQAPRPDLVFLDYNLPRVSGIEVLSRLKDRHGALSTAIVMMSGSSESTDIQAAKDMGVISYIVKPLSEQGLKEVVSMVPDLEFVTESGEHVLYAYG